MKGVSHWAGSRRARSTDKGVAVWHCGSGWRPGRERGWGDYLVDEYSEMLAGGRGDGTRSGTREPQRRHPHPIHTSFMTSTRHDLRIPLAGFPNGLGAAKDPSDVQRRHKQDFEGPWRRSSSLRSALMEHIVLYVDGRPKSHYGHRVNAESTSIVTVRSDIVPGDGD